MANPVIPNGLTAAQYTTIFNGVGTYNGNNKAYKGKPWGDVYTAVYKADVAAKKPNPAYEAALQVEILVMLQGDGAALTTSLGNFVTISGKSVVGGIDNFTSNPLGDIASAFGMLTSANLWLRVAKVLIGGVILTVGLIELTGHADDVKGVASKAVKTAPLLLA